jgi:transcriptional regulator with XRE-family HTH domain
MGWSQAELAERTDVSRDTVSRIERGQVPDAVFLGRLSEAAGVSCEWLVLGREGEGERGPQGRSALDESVLGGVLEGVEEELRALGVPMEPKKKAELVTLLYEMMVAEQGRRPDQGHIAKLVKLAS